MDYSKLPSPLDWEFASHRLTVVSRDTKEYTAARMAVFNPWTDPVRSAVL